MTSDQNCSAASRSRPSCRYTRTRRRDSSIAKKRRSHAQKNATIAGFVFAKSTLPSASRPRRRRGGAGGEEGVVGERADALDAERGRIPRSRRAWRRAAGADGGSPTRWRARGSKGTSRTQSDTDDFETPSSVAMSSERSALGAQRARLLLQLDLAAVPHAGSLPNRCSYWKRSTTLRGSRGGVASAWGDAASRASSTRSGGCARA